jgi:3-deoxy-D-glycero-D-galacto-nononate 9-phosphatase
MKIKLVLTDIDGVWTDGGMYYDNSDKELKRFNTSDSMGVLFLKTLNIPVGIITGENIEIVRRRAKKLHIDLLFMGAKNKLSIVNELCNKMNISLDEVAYIGDDINDIPLLEAVGISATPADARDYVKKYAKWQMKSKGGDGVFREFVERILTENNLLDKTLQKIIEGIKNSPQYTEQSQM